MKQIVNSLVAALILCSSISVFAFENFISRQGHELYDGEELFRFVSFNVPELSMRENPTWGIVHPFDQRDALKTIAQFGGKVTRTYVFSVAGTGKYPTHVMAPGEFSEEAFVAFDHLLSIANNEGVRLIVPFIDTWQWWGGIDQFAALRGKKAKDFYTDEQLKNDYKALVSFVLNRTNTVTGVKYKDDKAILAWETGNELRKAPTQWTLEMADFIKSIDPNHLVMDGNDEHTDEAIYESDNIDIITRHYYGDSFQKRHKTDVRAIAKRKPFIVGEFGLAPFSEISGLIGSVIDTDTSGALIWSLRQHDVLGGWHWHQEGTTQYRPYHYPGFESGSAYQEIDVIEMLKSAAAEINDEWETDDPIPEVPTLLPITSVLDIRWLGSVGARGYDIQREQNGQWKTLATMVNDSIYREDFSARKTVEISGQLLPDIKLQTMYQDLTAQKGQRYRYRIRAVNEAGASKWSAPVTSDTVDFSNGLNVAYDIAGGLELALMGDLTSLVFRSIWIDEPEELPQVTLSADGLNYVPARYDFQDNTRTKKSFDPTFIVSEVPEGIRFVNIKFPTEPEITAMLKYGVGDTRVELPVFKKRLWPLNVVDNFDVYEGLPQKLNEIWKRNNGGNEIRLSLDPVSDQKHRMRVDYELGNPNYAGFLKRFDEEDWSDYRAVKFEIETKTLIASTDFTVQFKSNTGSYWETSITLKAESKQTVELPFEMFTRPEWQKSSSAAKDMSVIVEMALYVGGGENGTYWIDDIELIN